MPGNMKLHNGSILIICEGSEIFDSKNKSIPLGPLKDVSYGGDHPGTKFKLLRYV